MFQQTEERNPNRRRAATAVMVVVTVPTLLATAALTVDVAVMYNTRADLQRSADAAAMAGASALLSDAMMEIRLGSDDESALSGVTDLANTRAAIVAALNPSLGTDTTLVDGTDIQVGYLDLSSATSALALNPAPPQHLNAVQVTVRRANEGLNGAVGFFFAPIFGAFSTDVSASATAAFDTRVAAYDPSGDWLLPFTLDKDFYEDQVENGGDEYSYDEDADAISPTGDEIPEIRLYPHYDDQGEEDTTSGNFGLLNIPGSSPLATPDLRDQIADGVDSEDLAEDTGDAELVFDDEGGDPITYELNGNPGFRSTLEHDVEARVGDIVAFLLHDDVGGCPGAKDGGCGVNTYYRTVDIRFGRVMAVDLSGDGPDGCTGIVVQPVAFSGPGIRLRNNGQTNLQDTAGLVVLAR